MAGQVMELSSKTNAKKGIIIDAKNWKTVQENLAGGDGGKWGAALDDFDGIDTSEIQVYQGEKGTYGALVEFNDEYRWMSIKDLIKQGALIETSKGVEVVAGTISRTSGKIEFNG